MATVVTGSCGDGPWRRVSGDIVEQVGLEESGGRGKKLLLNEAGSLLMVHTTLPEPGGLQRCCILQRSRMGLASKATPSKLGCRPFQMERICSPHCVMTLFSAWTGVRCQPESVPGNQYFQAHRQPEKTFSGWKSHHSQLEQCPLLTVNAFFRAGNTIISSQNGVAYQLEIALFLLALHHFPARQPEMFFLAGFSSTSQPEITVFFAKFLLLAVVAHITKRNFSYIILI